MNPALVRGQKVLADSLVTTNLEPLGTTVEWVSFNVGGSVFLTRKNTLNNVPGSLLAELDENSPHYHPSTGQFMFDRNQDLFPYILDFYRTGIMHFPHSLCGPYVKTELMFWGIDEDNVAPCCWSRYKEYEEQEETLEKLGTAFNVVDHFEQKKRNFVFSHVHKWRARIWYFLEDPKSSKFAQV